jgi:hypothetical protein
MGFPSGGQFCTRYKKACGENDLTIMELFVALNCRLPSEKTRRGAAEMASDLREVFDCQVLAGSG